MVADSNDMWKAFVTTLIEEKERVTALLEKIEADLKEALKDDSN